MSRKVGGYTYSKWTFPSHGNSKLWFCSRLWDTEAMVACKDLVTKHRMKRSDKTKLVARRLNIRYQLLLTWDKSLKTRGHTKSQLVNEGRLILAVDLNLDACFVRRLICGYSTPEDITTKCGRFSFLALEPILSVPHAMPFNSREILTC